MKHEVLVLLAAMVVGFVSCGKESVTAENENQIDAPDVINPQNESPRMITFSAVIDQKNNSTHHIGTKATLNDHAIEWAAGDYIGIATEKATTVTGYAVTPGVDPKTCSFEVAEVAGAECYYAIYTGSSDFSGITFDTSTKTFAGTESGKLIIKHGRYDSPTITHKEQLAMAGKANSNTTSISMKPCLALAKVRIGAESVASKHDGTYSGVRGFNFYQDPNASWGGGAPYSSGDYTVCLSGENMVVTSVDNAARYNFRDVETSNLLAADTDYYFAFIPAGDISGFRIDILGFKSDESTSSSIQYTFRLNQSLTVNPGDYFDIGTLDPVGNKKDEANFDKFAIDIDGVFTDWDGVTTTGGPNGGYTECKVTYDEYFIYFYSKTTGITWASGNYIYYCLDTDNNASTGGDLWSHAGFESIFYISPYSSTEGVFNGSPSIHRSYPGSVSATATCAGTYDAVSGVVELEVKVSRKAANVFKNDNIRIWSYASGSASGYFDLGSTLSITK